MNKSEMEFSAEQAEKMDDLIRRKALLEEFQYRLPLVNDEAKIIKRCVDISREIIEKAPSVEAEPVVHGHWIADEDGLDEDGNGKYRCSHCGVGEKHNPTVPVSYCWNCGAKMDGGGNG